MSFLWGNTIGGNRFLKLLYITKKRKKNIEYNIQLNECISKKEKYIK